MERLKIYRIQDGYIRYLSAKDNRVMYNKAQRRPYVGVVLTVGAYHYFVPMESPKPNHANMKPGKHLLFLAGGRYGLLGFNNMIPVPDSALIAVDISAESDRKYASLLEHQATAINKSKADIYDHAQRTYYDVVNGTNRFLSKICCDFKKLEAASSRYDPNFKPRRANKVQKKTS